VTGDIRHFPKHGVKRYLGFPVMTRSFGTDLPGILQKTFTLNFRVTVSSVVYCKQCVMKCDVTVTKNGPISQKKSRVKKGG